MGEREEKKKEKKREKKRERGPVAPRKEITICYKFSLVALTPIQKPSISHRHRSA